MLPLTVALAAAAPVAGAIGERDTGGFATFDLKASHGYRLFVIASSEAEYRRGRVVIWATRKKDSVIYVAPAEVTDTTVDADLGNLGTITLQFESSGKLEKTAPVCNPDSTATFEGAITSVPSNSTARRGSPTSASAASASTSTRSSISSVPAPGPAKRSDAASAGHG